MTDLQELLKSALSHAYDIERELPGGGMSRVFVAVERALGRRVVIKVLPPDLAAGVNTERFRREIQLSAQLNHPHIVPVLAAGEIGEMLYYTMPYIEGESLNNTVQRNGPLEPREVLRILHDVVDALAYAHSRGVIHRDIKPANILSLGNHALVTDFGVAKAISASLPGTGATSGGFAIGTPSYMAPEQLAADPLADHRMDIYAVGLLAYELLIGTSPFMGTSPQATMAAQLTRVPEPLHKLRPDVPAPVSALIQRCLEKLPENRPATAQELLRELDEIFTPSGGFTARRPTFAAALANPGKHAKYLTRVALSAMLILVGVFGLTDLLRGKTREFANAQVAGGQVDDRLTAEQAREMDRKAVLLPAATSAAQASAAAAAAAAAATAANPPEITEAQLAAYLDSMRALIMSEVRRDSVAITDSLRDAIERDILDSLARMRSQGMRGGDPRFSGGGGARGGPLLPRNTSDLRRPPPPGERRVLVTNFIVRIGRPDSSLLSSQLGDSLRAALTRRSTFRAISDSTARAIASSDDPRVWMDRVHASAALIGSVEGRRGDSVVVRLRLAEPSGPGQAPVLASYNTSLGTAYLAIDSLLPRALSALATVNWPVSARGGRRGGGNGAAPNFQQQFAPGSGRGGVLPPPASRDSLIGRSGEPGAVRPPG